MKLSVKIIIVLASMLLLLAWRFDAERQRRKVAEGDVSRLKENQKEQAKKDSARYTHLLVRVDEVEDVVSHKVDSIMKANNIKSKNTERIIERYYYYSDVDSDVVKPDPVESPIGRIFPFDRWFDCMHLIGYMKVDSLAPSLVLTHKEYADTLTDIAHLERTKRFLGIKYGPFRAKLYSTSECSAKQKIKDIEIIRDDKRRKR